MQIQVVFYGGLKERCGRRTASVELEAPASVRDALEVLVETFPPLSGRLERIALAVDDELVDADRPLEDGDELCLLPPVSGGEGERI